MNIENQLARTALFQGIDSDALSELARACKQRSLEKGAELFSAGDRADFFYLIVEGWIKLYRVSRDGDEAIIHVFGPGETFAEAAVFNDRRAYPVHAQAVDNVVLIAVPRSFFVRKIQSDSNFALRILAAIASRQHYLVQQLEQVTARSAPQRIGAFLLRVSHAAASEHDVTVTLPYDKSLIAARLSIKPETFSRALAKLRPHGVTSRGRMVQIADPQVLAEFCDMDWQSTPCG